MNYFELRKTSFKTGVFKRRLVVPWNVALDLIKKIATLQTVQTLFDQTLKSYAVREHKYFVELFTLRQRNEHLESALRGAKLANLKPDFMGRAKPPESPRSGMQLFIEEG